MKRGLAEVVVKVNYSSILFHVQTDFFMKGVPTIHRAVINIKEKDDAKGKKGDKELLVEGYGLQKCMITEGNTNDYF